MSVAASSLIWYALYSLVFHFFFEFALQLIAYGFCRVIPVLIIVKGLLPGLFFYICFLNCILLCLRINLTVLVSSWGNALFKINIILLNIFKPV